MKELIERYIQGQYTFLYQHEHPTISRNEIHNQVLAFLTRGGLKERNNQRQWLRALGAVLNRSAKVDLVADLLRKAKTTIFEDYDTLLVDAAMEIIYPPTTLGRVKTEVKSDKERDNHYYISFNHNYFARAMLKWSQEISGEINFIDVGCGLGDKLVLATWFVDGVESVTGIEINTHVYNLGRFFIGNLYATHDKSWGRVFDDDSLDHGDFPIPLTMTEGDAFDVDYEPYNLIYMYQPIADVRKMKELHLHILETMPVGGLMIETLPPLVRETDGLRSALPHHKNLSVLDSNHYLVVKKIA